MADKTIPELTEKESLVSTDVFAVDDGTQSYKVALSTLILAIPGVTGIALNNTGDGFVVSFRTRQPVEIITHDSTKQNVLTFDDTPTEGSTNPVKSGGVYSSVAAVAGNLTAEASTARTNEGTLAGNILTALQNLAPYEATDVASQEYTVGRLLIRNNLVLYKVTNTIPSNTSIKPSGLDANVEVATIEDIIHLTKPISEGGTGATTAADARDNLGLGTAAVKDVAAGVIEDDTDLPTSGDVYTAVKSVQDALDNFGFYIDSVGYICQEID